MRNSPNHTSAAPTPPYPDAADPLLRFPSRVTRRTPSRGTEPPAPHLTVSLELLDRAFAEFLRHAEGVKRHSAATLRWYAGAYASYRRYLTDVPAGAGDAFTRRALDIDGWVAAHRHVESVTINSYWRALRRFFVDWHERGGGPNPFAGRRAPRVRSYLPKALPYDDCARIMFTARNYPWPSMFDQKLALAVLGVMLYAGLRLHEVCRLLVQDVDLRAGTIRVVRGKGYGGGKDRIAYLAPELATLLHEYLRERYVHTRALQPPELFVTPRRGGPIGEFTIHDIVRRIRTACGIHFTAHVLRHSFVTHLIRSGAPIHVVRDLAGHASVATTMGYLKVFDEDRKATLEHLQFLAPVAERQRASGRSASDRRAR